jgi:16S rRNA G966 N2-methylase RsmD
LLALGFEAAWRGAQRAEVVEKLHFISRLLQEVSEAVGKPSRRTVHRKMYEDASNLAMVFDGRLR